MLRGLIISALVFSASLAGLRADAGTAMSALQTARSVAPNGTLVVVTGDHGEPRPSQWTYLFSDPSARGGVREVVVSGDVIISQRTPLSGYSGIPSQAPVQVNQVTMDSDAAFHIADKQAREQQLGFHWIDYALRADDQNGAPLWVLRLFDHMGAQVGSIKISAANGSIVSALRATDTPRNNENTGNFQNSESGQKIGGAIGFVSDVAQSTANKVKDTTLRTVGNVQEILTGRRTIGPPDDE